MVWHRLRGTSRKGGRSMNQLRNHLQTPHSLTEHLSKTGYTYTLRVTGADALFHLDDPQNPPWKGGPVPDGIVLGRADNTPYVVFLELKAVVLQKASGHTAYHQSERAQIEKAYCQILSGVFHFLPLCQCHSMPPCPKKHPGEEHHQRWPQDLGPVIPEIPQYQGHEVRGTIVLFWLNLQRTISPPPKASVRPRNSQLGGQDLCPAKPIPKFKILYRSIPANGTVTIPFAQMV